MPKLCLSGTPKTSTTQFLTLILRDLLLFFSFIISHPLYFSYFIFFSPYLLKLLSFLSPLFITTSLLLLCFLTVSPLEFSESKVGFLLSTYYTVRERLRSNTENEDDEFHHFEELEVYKSIFDTSTVYARENLEEKTVEIAWEEKRLQGFLQEFDEFENMTCNVEEKKVEKLGIKPDEVKEEEVVVVGRGSKEMGDKIRGHAVKVSTDNGGEYNLDKLVESPSSRTFESSLGSYGSMGKEKEWKRTLACKLFEERHNVGGGEGMDSLWETYEMDSSNKVKPKSNNAKMKNKKKSDLEDDDDYEGEDSDGQLCCLQALKFSSGKMNFGMRRPNLAKISKAIKGIGWLHHVTRHGRNG